MRKIEERHDKPTGFTLWHRRARPRPWEPVATEATEAELHKHLDGIRSGDVMTLPTGEHPDDRRRPRSAA